MAGLWVTFEKTTCTRSWSNQLSVVRLVIISNYTLPGSSVTVPPKGCVCVGGGCTVWGVGALKLAVRVIFDYQIDGELEDRL